jgi:glycosyltransferase involved in cell wall biosynthesis
VTSSDTPLGLGFLGRLHQKKSLSLLIKAPPKWDTNVSLTIVEIDPEEEALKTKANALGVTDRINWLGFVRDKEAFFEQIDILVMPSEYECSGMAADEAIVSHETGIDEIVKNYGGGQIIESATDQIVPAIGELLEQPDRRTTPSEQII